MSGLSGNVHIVINDTDTVGGAGSDTDTMKLSGKWSDWTVTHNGLDDGTGSYTLTRGDETITVSNVEQFTFMSENNGAGGTVSLSQLMNVAPVAEDFVALNAVTEDSLSKRAEGYILHNNHATDVNTNAFDTLAVVGINAGSTPSATSNVSGSNGTVVEGLYGHLTIFADGAYAYALDDKKPATDALSAGQQVTDIFDYTVADAHGVTSSATITVNVNGTNDAPTISAGAVSATLVEAGYDVTGTSSATVQLTKGDVDNGDSASYNTADWIQSGVATIYTKATTYGSVSLDTATGLLTYTLDASKSDSLAGGTRTTDSVVVTVKDGSATATSTTVTFNVDGTNDAPTISAGSVSTTLVEAGYTVAGTSLATVQLTKGDVDTGDSASYSTTGWTETAFAGAYTKETTYGSVSLNTSTGRLTYTLDPSKSNSLAGGTHTTDSVVVAVTDENGATSATTVTFNVNGTNDAPTISAGAVSSTLVEAGYAVAGTSSATVQLTKGDVDNGDSASYKTTGWTQNGNTETYTKATTHGSVSLDTSTGLLTYTLDASTSDSLAGGTRTTDSVVVTVKDASGAEASQTITFNVDGTNDAPTISAGLVSATLVEAGYNVAGTSLATVQLTKGDVDIGDRTSYNTTDWTKIAFTTAYTKETTYGEVSLNTSTGRLTYTLDPSKSNSLAGGTHTTDSVMVTVKDGSGIEVSKTITFNVDGTNDAPTISAGSVSATLVEAGYNVAGTSSATVQLTKGDVDAGDSASYNTADWIQSGVTTTYTKATTYGSVSLDTATGLLTYTLDASKSDSLTGGTHATDSVTVTVKDGSGAEASQTITFNVDGTNDAPVNTVATSGFSATAGTALSVSGLSVSDVDSANLTTIVSVEHGTLFSTSATGVSNNGSGSVTITGTQAQINDALAHLSYTATSGYSGGDTLTIKTSDLYVTDTDSVAISVTPPYLAGAKIFTNVSSSAVSLTPAELAWASGASPSDVNSVQQTGNIVQYNIGTATYQNTVKASENLDHRWAATSEILIANTDGQPYQTIFVHAGSANDVLVGASWAGGYQSSVTNLLYGGSGNDLLIGGNGRGVVDFMWGQGGDNTYLVGYHGGDRTGYTEALGDEGIDIVDFSNVGAISGAGVAFTLEASGTIASWTLVSNEYLHYDNIEGVRGTQYNDALTLDDDGTWRTNYNANLSVDGGAGTDTLRLDGSNYIWNDSQILNIETVAMASSGTLDLSTQTEGFTITGTSGNDAIYGGSANDIITGGSGSDTIDAGAGDDIIYGTSSDSRIDGDTGVDTVMAAAGFNDTSLGNSGIINVEKITLTSAGVLTLSQQTENLTLTGSGGADTITGGKGSDTIIGGSGNDTIIGGGGGDTLTGDTGADQFVWGSEATGTANADKITDYTYNSRGSLSDKIDLDNLVSSVGRSVSSYVKLVNSGNDLLVQVDANGTTQGSSWTTIYTLVGGNTSGTDRVRIDIGGSSYDISISNTGTLTYSAAIDPVILDLDHNGLALTSQSNGVSFDLNGDGAKDQVAWTTAGARDGILGIDLNHDGQINNGSELFTTGFNGGSYASGMAALATLDTNHDGKIDASDTAYSQLAVWQDLNHNGITDAGELTTLANDGISSISLSTTSASASIADQSVLSEGTYTNADGSVGHLSEVAFDTGLGQVDAGQINLVGTDGSDTLTSGGGYTMTGGAGGDTFFLDAQALHSLNMVDVITDFNPKGDGDKLDVSNLLNALVGEHPGMTDAAAAASMTATVDTATNSTAISINTGSESHVVATLQNYAPTGQDAVHVLFNNHDEQLAIHTQTAGA